MTTPTPKPHAPKPPVAPSTHAADDMLPPDPSDPREAHPDVAIARPDPDKVYPEGAELSAAPSKKE